jgi:nucleotide-binding universal stress UspA family protein
MKRILVPIDLRSDYENTLNYARSVAQRAGAELTLLLRSFPGLARNAARGYTAGEDARLILLPGTRTAQALSAICQSLREEQVAFRLRFTSGRTIPSIIRESERSSYDLLMIAGETVSGAFRWLRGAIATRLIGSVRVPVFVVPARSRFNEIRHITYAVDLNDYDPAIVQQVKSIAALFDAKLTIAHVNETYQESDRERYLLSLERTISDTLDYPKVYYKFFDHADPFGGIKKFVSMSDSNLLAMINRKKFTWKDLFSPKSLTRKMAKEISIPLLAFKK